MSNCWGAQNEDSTEDSIAYTVVMNTIKKPKQKLITLSSHMGFSSGYKYGLVYT